MSVGMRDLSSWTCEKLLIKYYVIVRYRRISLLRMPEDNRFAVRRSVQFEILDRGKEHVVIPSRVIAAVGRSTWPTICFPSLCTPLARSRARSFARSLASRYHPFLSLSLISPSLPERSLTRDGLNTHTRVGCASRRISSVRSGRVFAGRRSIEST